MNHIHGKIDPEVQDVPTVNFSGQNIGFEREGDLVKLFHPISPDHHITQDRAVRQKSCLSIPTNHIAAINHRPDDGSVLDIKIRETLSAFQFLTMKQVKRIMDAIGLRASQKYPEKPSEIAA